MLRRWQALSDVDEEGALTSNRARQVVIDGKGLVSLCPDLGYYYDLESISDAGMVSYETPQLQTGALWEMQARSGERIGNLRT